MGRSRNWKHGNCGKFGKVPRDLLDTPEWQDLSLAARLNLIEAITRWKFRSPFLLLLYSKAPCNPRTHKRSIEELTEKGWLEKVRPGGLYRQPTHFRLGPQGARWWPQIAGYK